MNDTKHAVVIVKTEVGAVVIVKTEPGKVVKEFDVTGWSERRIANLMAGMSINLNHDEYHIERRTHA